MKYALVFAIAVVFIGGTSSCKDTIVPPDRIIIDTTNHGPDTTSHNFVWAIDTLGDGSGGALYDVVIVNDTLAFAVGEIYLRDSTGQIDPQLYNLAKWDGSRWSIERITLFLHNFDCTIAGTYIGDLATVFSFDDGKVVFTDGADVVLWNGISYSHLPCSFAARNGGFTRFWGGSSNDFYAVGASGTVAHFDGSTWTKMESGTVLGFTDVWGSSRTDANQAFVMAVASDFIHSHRVIALSAPVPKDTLSWTFDKIPYSAWFSATSPYYISGSGLWEWNQTWEQIDSVVFFNRIRGSADNNIFAFGGGVQSALRHYNGSTWKEFPEVQIPFAFARGLAVKESIVMAAGFIGDIPFVIRGYRQ